MRSNFGEGCEAKWPRCLMPRSSLWRERADAPLFSAKSSELRVELLIIVLAVAAERFERRDTVRLHAQLPDDLSDHGCCS